MRRMNSPDPPGGGSSSMGGPGAHSFAALLTAAGLVKTSSAPGRRRYLAAAAFLLLVLVILGCVLAQFLSLDPHRNDPQGSAFPSSMYHQTNDRPLILLEYKGINHDVNRKRPKPPSCRPQRVRVAQRNDTDSSSSSVVSMTLSFELDRVHCSPSALSSIVVECEPLESTSSNASVTVVVLPEIEKNEVADQDIVTTPSTATFTVHVEPVQFDYQTEAMRRNNNETFRSDYIYHVPLEGLRSGMVRYSYQIRVVMKQGEQRDDDGSAGSVPDSSQGGVLVQQKRSRSRNLPRLRSHGHPRNDNGTTTYVGEFVTPPRPSMPTRLALVGDLGRTWYSTLTMLHIWREAMNNKTTGIPVTNLVIAGDMSYADSDPDRWTSWFDLMEPLLRTLPTHVAAGNHELECDRDGNLFTFYEKCFVSPNRVQNAIQKPYSKRSWEVWKQCSHPSQFRAEYDYGNAYYSYEHGLAKIVVLSSYSHTAVNSTQYRWLQNELSTKFSRDRTPWLVAVFHSPFYTTFLGHQEEEQTVTMRAAMEDLFVHFGVNLVVSGHDHAYMRTHPMYRGQVVEWGRAPVYWTLGAGGNREGHSQGYAHSTPEPWVAQRSLADFGYGSLYMPNGTHAQLTWMRDGVGIGLKVDEMAVDDSAWIVNSYSASSNAVVA